MSDEEHCSATCCFPGRHQGRCPSGQGSWLPTSPWEWRRWVSKSPHWRAWQWPYALTWALLLEACRMHNRFKTMPNSKNVVHVRRSADEAEATGRGALWFMTKDFCWLTISYWCVLRREFSGMIHFITSNSHPSNSQQPIHALRKTHQYDLARVHLNQDGPWTSTILQGTGHLRNIC
jgi:hypothetical protein